MDIAELLAFSVKHNASDLHLSAGLPPMIRVDGDIRRINVPALDHKIVHGLVYDIMNDKQRKDFEEFYETIVDPRRIEGRMMRACRRIPGRPPEAWPPPG
mgnify:CR=1 FL=1